MKILIIIAVLLFSFSCGEKKHDTDFSLTSIVQDGGRLSGGEVVEIHGEGFRSGLKITIGGIDCEVENVTDTKAFCLSGQALSASWADVEVSFGEQTEFLENSYAYGLQVLGQETLLTGDRMTTNANSLFNPVHAIAYNDQVLIGDFRHHRLLIYPIETSGDITVTANQLRGQDSFISTAGANAGGTVAIDTVNFPAWKHIHSNGELYIADSYNNRILVWSSFPTSLSTDPDFVLGQIDFDSNSSGTTASSLNLPFDICKTPSGIVFVSDYNNSRVLQFNTVSTGQSASLVLGQADFVSGAANRGSSADATTLNRQQGIYCDDQRLIVADRLNNRVLIWSPLPSSDGETADLVLGQADFNSVLANRGSDPAANTFNNPVHVNIIDSKLYVVDVYNHRILIWNTFPTQNGQAADIVYGQDDFVSNTANRGLGEGELDHRSLNAPLSVSPLGNDRLMITEYSNNRIIIIPRL